MSEIRRSNLFGKLNSLSYKSVESATVFCKMRGNPYVEVAHWLHQVLQLADSDLHRIIRHFGLEPARVARDLTEALDRLPRGASAVSDLSPHVEELAERGWVYASLLFGQSKVRTGHLVVGALKTRGLAHVLTAISREFEKINADELAGRYQEVTAGSVEEGLAAAEAGVVGGAAAPGEVSGAIAPAAMGKQEALRQFSVDLTEQARNGEIDPIIGRDAEIRQVVDVLMRRRQNNPMLTGEAGVGKTAVVEGFALRIAAGDVPPPLRDVTLRTLDVGALQAGASMKGEFENRLKQVIEEVQASEKPVILFIDEAHTLVGAGGAEGVGDAANLLKPALARGRLRTIAATTWAEYKKHIEKDPALTRRFQVVQVQEPSEAQALRMMRSMASTLEKHHRAPILDEALEASVSLSHRYIPARQLPDKSVSLLDTACARVAISQHAVPAEVDDSRRQIESLETELAILKNEAAGGFETTTRQERAVAAIATERERLGELEARWEKEKDLVGKVLEIHGKLRAASDDGPLAAEATSAAETPSIAPAAAPIDREKLVAELTTLKADLATLQGETPLITPFVDKQAVASVVADWTGIPVGSMVRNEVAAVLGLKQRLSRRVLGQDHALETIAKRVQTARANLDNPSKPVGVFLLAGPSGVGKTETALTLAEALYGGEQNVITINMSEFQEAHTVSTLKGAPPGYVGYGEGGVLTEAVRRRPYSVVLLDEVEKAHPDVHEIFFQVFDKGVMEDGEGRLIDFKNTIILLTSNVGSDLVMSLCKDPDLMPSADALARALREPALKVFPAALLGRLTMVPYFPLSDAMVGDIARLQLGRVAKRMMANHGVRLDYGDEVVKLIASRCTELESGGRMIDAILTSTMLPALSTEILTRMLDGASMSAALVKVSEGEFAFEYE
ncbi:MAG: type VI secretion system ATPase TssH [Lacipirellulaceae bacterium]